MAISEKSTYRIYIVLLYLLIFQNLLQEFIGIFGYFDELLISFGCLLGIIKFFQRPVIKKGSFLIPITLMIIFGVLGNCFYNYQKDNIQVVLAAFSNIKFWVAISMGTTLFKRLNFERFANKILWHVERIISLYVILTVLDIILNLFPAQIRYGFRAIQLFYGTPTAYAAYCGFLFALMFFLKKYVKVGAGLFIIDGLLMCTTMRSKAFATVCIFILIYYFAYIRKKKITVRTLLLFVPVLLLIVWDQIYFYFFSSIQNDSARYQLTITAIKIMRDHFPIGSGFATFGSYFSGISYSSIYDLYGISKVNGLRDGAFAFISDSFWPMLFGETGILGSMMFIDALILLFRKIQKLRKFSIAQYTSGLCVFVYLIISSMAESAFVNPVIIPMALLLGIILYSNQNYERKVVEGGR